MGSQDAVVNVVAMPLTALPPVTGVIPEPTILLILVAGLFLLPRATGGWQRRAAKVADDQGELKTQTVIRVDHRPPVS